MKGTCADYYVNSIRSNGLLLLSFDLFLCHQKRQHIIIIRGVSANFDCWQQIANVANGLTLKSVDDAPSLPYTSTYEVAVNHSK